MSCSHSLIRRIIERTKIIDQHTIIYDYKNHRLLRRMRLRRGSLRIHGRTGDDAALSLSGLPAIQRRSVFVFRGRAEGSVQARERLTALPWLGQWDGWPDSSRLLR